MARAGLQRATFMSHKVAGIGGEGYSGIAPKLWRGAEGERTDILSNFPENFPRETGSDLHV